MIEWLEQNPEIFVGWREKWKYGETYFAINNSPFVLVLSQEKWLCFMISQEGLRFSLSNHREFVRTLYFHTIGIDILLASPEVPESIKKNIIFNIDEFSK